MKGVAAHVLDEAPPPLELQRALNYQAWGVGDIMNLPAGMLTKMNLALNYHRALVGYKRAAKGHQTVEFSKKNPQEWELVTWVLAKRKEGW